MQRLIVLHYSATELPNAALQHNRTTKRCITVQLNYQTLHYSTTELPNAALQYNRTTKRCITVQQNYQIANHLVTEIWETACKKIKCQFSKYVNPVRTASVLHLLHFPFTTSFISVLLFPCAYRLFCLLTQTLRGSCLNFFNHTGS